MTITFLKVPPEQINDLPPLALEYLENAIIRTPASTERLDVMLDIARKGYGNTYLIYDGEDLKGAAYILTYDTKHGKVVSPVLIGGNDMDSWDADAKSALKQFCILQNASTIYFIGRKGWKKKYPAAKIIGYVYEMDVLRGI